MKETKLAHEFHKLFADYPIFVVVNKTIAGWPDRMLQLPNSNVCFVELKVVKLSVNNTINISNFEANQAAFMAKWHRNGGLCFLLLAAFDAEEKQHYGVISPAEWRVWAQAPRKIWRPGDMEVFSEDKAEILKWFDWWKEPALVKTQ